MPPIFLFRSATALATATPPPSSVQELRLFSLSRSPLPENSHSGIDDEAYEAFESDFLKFAPGVPAFPSRHHLGLPIFDRVAPISCSCPLSMPFVFPHFLFF